MCPYEKVGWLGSQDLGFSNRDLAEQAGNFWKRTTQPGYRRLRVAPHFSSGIVERAKHKRAWKSPHARKARRGGEREKWKTTDKVQAFNPTRPTDFGVWSSYPLPNQLSASNGIPSLIELSSVNWGGYLLWVKENPDTNFLHGCFVWSTC